MLRHIRRPFSEDYNIEQVTQLTIYSTAIDNSKYTAIPSLDCESVLVKCRTAANKYYVASSSNPDEDYMTVEAGDSFTADIDKSAGGVICYIKGTAASDYVECMASA